MTEETKTEEMTPVVISNEEWLRMAGVTIEKLTAQLANVMDASKEGSWMARALDAERERDSAEEQCLAAEAKAETYKKDWYDAKAEFGAASVKLRAEIGSHTGTIAMLRANLKMGEEAMALQAANLTDTIRRQRDEINYLKERDHGSFGWVLRCLNNLNDNRWVFRRKGWNGKGMFIGLQRPTDLSKMTLPYIFMHTVQGDYVPWLASQTDMLSTDWEEAD